MESKITSPKDVFRYYPHRVGIFVQGLLVFLFAGLEEAGVYLSAVFVAAVVGLGGALMTFFYGEKKSSSNAAVAEWLVAESDGSSAEA